MIITKEMKTGLKEAETKIKKLIFPYILRRLKETAYAVVEREDPLVVGVTGSVGKSTFIYLLDAVIRNHFKTKTTLKGNSETGIPLEILGLRDLLKNYSLFNWLVILAATPLAHLFSKFDFDVLVAEMAIDSSKPPKNMSYLLEIIRPDIGVFLNVSAAHTQQFAKELKLTDPKDVIRAIASEKGKIVTELPKEAQAIINIDSDIIKELIPKIEAQITTFGENENADYRLIEHQVTSSGTTFGFSSKGEEFTIHIDDYTLPRKNGLTILAVVIVALKLGMDLSDVVEKIEKEFTIPAGRMSLIKGKNKSHIIDSSYNSSPEALQAALEMLKTINCEGKKILILGDMRELGPLEEAHHKEIADSIAEIADLVILIGPLMKKYLYPELLTKGVKVQTREISLGLGEQLLEDDLINPNDLIFVKGSQNTIFLEQVVYELMEEQAEAKTLLCRQDKYWKKVRDKFFAGQVKKT